MSAAIIAARVAQRSLILIPRIPSTFIPSLLMPVFLTISFSGQFSGLVDLPGFPAEKIIDWILPMTMVQGSTFAGITTGMGVARDLESGFYDRLLLSPASRSALVAGPLLASMLRALFPLALMPILALLGGANLPGGIAGVGTLAIACFGASLCGGAWALGIALRFKTTGAAPLMQTGAFLTLFLSTAHMPIELLTGWLHNVARFNPATNVLALAREGFLGPVDPSGVWPGIASLAGLIAVLLVFVTRGMRKLSP